MENKAQISIEYLIMVGMGIVLATIVVLLAANLFGIKESIKELIEVHRERTLQMR